MDQNMMIWLLALGVVVLIVAAGGLYLYLTEQPEEGCPEIYKPVCGEDGKTYSNDCFAGQAGVNVSYEGECTVCSETDGGKDIQVAGTTTSDGSAFDDKCAGTSAIVEFYCLDGELEYETLACPSGFECSAGACVEVAEEVSCKDTEPETSLYSSGTVSIEDATGITKYSDVCVSDAKVTEYSCDGSRLVTETLACPTDYTCLDGACHSAEACYDNDGGGTGSMYVPGIVFSDFAIYEDYCSGDNTLIEYSCVEGSQTQDIVICPSDYRCRDGACVPEGECYDSDDGRDYYERGTTEVNGDEETDECVDDDTVREYYCDDNEIDSRTHDCGSGYHCSSGRCVSDSEPEVTCEDSDGIDYYELGYVFVTGDDLPTYDICVGDTLHEYRCVGNERDYISYTCPDGYGCSGGVCAPSCHDSDGGNVIGTAGTVTYGTDSEDDYCLFGQVVEWVCDADPADGYHALAAVSCPSGQFCDDGACLDTWCTDDDGGLDRYTESTTTSYTGESETDYCYDETRVREYYCEDDAVAYRFLDCPPDYICDTDGAGECIPLTCSDSDGGNEPTIAGTVTFGEDSAEDTCDDFGYLTEWVCQADPTDGYEYITPTLCSVGTACVINPTGPDACEYQCSDTDGGLYEDVYGEVTIPGRADPYADYCLDSNTVVEYYCGLDNRNKKTEVDCAFDEECADGRCHLRPFGG